MFICLYGGKIMYYDQKILTVTDSLFTGRHLPSEDYQFSNYKAALERTAAARIFKTFDIGFGSAPECLGSAREKPVFGFDSTRVALSRREILKTQFRALCRAAYHGEVSAAIPMLNDAGEFESIRALLNKCVDELRFERRLFGAVRLGVMIETPAAAISCDGLAEKADLLIINTDRLSSFTLAADLGSKALNCFYRPDHPSVLYLIEKTAKSAKRFGKYIAVSGCLASCAALAPFFVETGIDELFIKPEILIKTNSKTLENLPYL